MKGFLILLLMWGWMGACEFKQSTDENKAASNPTEVPVGTKLYWGFDEASAFVFQGPPDCSTSLCPTPNFESDQVFKSACERDGFKMVKSAMCCSSVGACTGLPKNVAADTGDVKIGDKVYPDFAAETAFNFEGFDPKSCELVRCAPLAPGALEAFQGFEAACKADGFKIVKTGCCNPGACTGLPKTAERIAGIKTGDKVYPSLKEADAVVYKGFDPSSCAAVLCAAPSPALLEAFKEFRAECEKDGFQVVKINCCDLGACTGLPKK